MAAEFPARIGPYDVVGVLGSGHLGTVYKAFDEAHSRVVSIRVLAPDLLADAPRLERFRHNVQLSAATVHENLLRTLDEGQDGHLIYTVAEYVDGCPLSERLERGRLTLAEAVHVLRDVADGLGAAHRAGLLHGDLNPRNVFVSRDFSVVKVGDFGTADATQSGASARTAVLARARIGSALYRAPELAGDRGEPTVSSDVYSLGVIAYEAMTGKLPVGKFSLPSDINNQVPLELDPIVLRCLATEPAQRYQSVAALVGDLDKVEEVVDYRLLNELKRLSGGRLFGEKRAPRRRVSRPRSMPLYAGLAALALIAIAVTAALLLRMGSDDPSRPVAAAAKTARPEPAPASTPPVSTALPQPAPSPAPVVDPAAVLPASTPPAPAAAGPPGLAAPAASVVSPPANTAAPGGSPPQGAATQRSGSTPAPSPTRQSPAGRAGAPPPPATATVKPSATAAAKPVPGPAPAAPDPDQSASALFTEAQALIKANQELEARSRLASIGERHSQSRWFVPAMMVKIDIEDRRALREMDPVIGQMAPASLQTKRLLIERAPQHPTAEVALWQIGETYDGLKQYALAVQSFVQLATRFPNTRLDAWFRAGEITDRRLKNKEDARAAYLKVPPTSARYEDAQDRARKLAGR